MIYSGFFYPGLTLAYQALEMYVKGSIRLSGDSKKYGHHDLVKLLRTKRNINGFTEISGGDNKKFLDTLSEFYRWGRFGEASISNPWPIILHKLDELAFWFDQKYLELMHSKTGTRLFIPKEPTALRDIFLANNHYFKIEMITDHPLSNLIPFELPDLPE